jgi:transcriptional regulator with XRE-family HTH domain
MVQSITIHKTQCSCYNQPRQVGVRTETWVDGVGREIKRLRDAKDWTGAQLAVYAGMSPSAVSQIETGQRSANTASLTKLADALGVRVADLFPKDQAPLPLEDSEQRRHAGVEGLANIQALVRRRLSRFDWEVSDPESTKFKSATLATDWLTDVQNEATDWITWGLNDAVASEASTVDTLRAGLWALGLIAEIGRIKRLAERRIQANQEPPDELAHKRAEVASRGLQEAGRRLQEFQAASG